MKNLIIILESLRYRNKTALSILAIDLGLLGIIIDIFSIIDGYKIILFSILMAFSLLGMICGIIDLTLFCKEKRKEYEKI